MTVDDASWRWADASGNPIILMGLPPRSAQSAHLQSFVAGPPKNGVQFMVKDSKKYASTGGWGFAQFNDGKPADEAVHNTCFSCHEAVKARDFVFARYAP